ncbi:hypothetical protein CHUUTOTORO_01270 [Serratia phage vB_SmaM-ChuuTotoro]|nr:hypothetical protein CHUUTOTORO_01270 [Serratia phage vB_SmaM-ChuuTotoro]
MSTSIHLSREQLLFIASRLAEGEGTIETWASTYNFREGIPTVYAIQQIRDYIESVRD